jgi:hypothetical protein
MLLSFFFQAIGNNDNKNGNNKNNNRNFCAILFLLGRKEWLYDTQKGN